MDALGEFLRLTGARMLPDYVEVLRSMAGPVIETYPPFPCQSCSQAMRGPICPYCGECQTDRYPQPCA